MSDELKKLSNIIQRENEAPLTLAEFETLENIYSERAEMQAAIRELWDVLGEARNGLEWYRDEYPQDASEADNEMLNKIELTLENTKKWSA